MTRLFIIIFFEILSILFISSCSFTDENLKSGWWKYEEGYHIGDIINFNYDLLVGDTIVRNGQKMALMTKRMNRYIVDNKIIISSLDHKETGVYVQK